MKINGLKVTGDSFAYDGCHKIYVLENAKQIKEAESDDYAVLPITDIKRVYRLGCSLKFIKSWNLERVYAKQGRNAIFED